jgi:moderate conductance mechanosensitive channel
VDDQILRTGSEALNYINDRYFNWHAIISLVACVGVALILGHVIAEILRRVVNVIGKQADQSQNLKTVNRLRRYETYIVLSIALIRTGLVLFSLYFWWLIDHADGQPTALIGASALLIVLVSAAFGPVLRDIANGSVMMAEQWYGVGDHVRVEPFGDVQGVVERVTLRSTRIRSLNGEVMWINNQHIQAIRITPRGSRTIALELFVNDAAKGEALVEAANDRLPSGPLLLVSPLQVIELAEVGKNLWHITAIGETAPGREWLLEQSAVELLKSLDDPKKPIIEHGPLARYSDSEADKRFQRTITNARKQPRARTKVVKKRTRSKASK